MENTFDLFGGGFLAVESDSRFVAEVADSIFTDLGGVGLQREETGYGGCEVGV
jgi:hypothetical protein